MDDKHHHLHNKVNIIIIIMDDVEEERERVCVVYSDSEGQKHSGATSNVD